jgi:hypothetical protein
MKRHMTKNIFYALLAITTIIGVIACEKNLIDENQEWQFTDDNATNIKIVNTWTHVVKGVTATRFLGFQDNNRIMGNGLAAPGVWPGTTYAQVKPGVSSILLLQDRKIAAVGTTPASIAAPVQGDTAILRSVTIDAKKYYSMFLAGDSLARDLVVVEDKLENLDTVTYALRFANMVVISPAQSVRLFSRREGKDIFTNIAYKQVTDFVKLKYDLTIDTLDVFSGTTRLYSLNASPKGRGKMYTVYSQGKTGVRTPTVNFYTNR